MNLQHETPELCAGIPPRLIESLRSYGIRHFHPGSFLRSVLENDLRRAWGSGNAESWAALPAIMSYCVMVLPAVCWGSPEVVRAWLTPAAPPATAPPAEVPQAVALVQAISLKPVGGVCDHKGGLEYWCVECKPEMRELIEETLSRR